MSREMDLKLIKAADNGDAAACRYWLAHGVDVNARDGIGWSALRRSIDRGHADICQLLIECGAVLDDTLLLAVPMGHTDICRLLLERGADVHVANPNGTNALHMAAGKDHMDICRFLIKHGADVHAVDQYGWNALHLAAFHNGAAACIFLLEHGGNPLIKTKDGETALDLAIDKGCENCIQVMRAWIVANAARAALQETATNTSLRMGAV